jgi:hypothetical protein
MTDHLLGVSKHSPNKSNGERRDLRLDACRGLALWFTFIDHIPGNSLSWLTLRNYGFSDMSEVFVFISGYTCMLAYGGALREQGWLTIVTRALRRAWEIYAAFLLLLIAYFIVIWAAGGGGRFLDETNTKPFFENPGAALVHAATLQYMPVNTDILPIFVLLHLAFPAVLWLFNRINGTATLIISFVLYLGAQLFSWNLPAWPTGDLYFNPLAWQFLFVLGAWYAKEGAVQFKTILQSRALLVLSSLFLILSLAITLSWQFELLAPLIPDAISRLIYPIYKSSLAPLRLLHFLALAILASRLVPADWEGLVKPWAMALIRCGENSLALYSIGILLSFAGLVILSRFSATVVMQIAVSLAGIALLIAAADLMTWVSKHDRPGPKLF